MGHDLVPNMVGDLSVPDLFQPEVRRPASITTPKTPLDLEIIPTRPDICYLLLGSTSSTFSVRMSCSVCSWGPWRRPPASRWRSVLTLTASLTEDLVGRNIFRSREVNLPTYAGLAECFGVTPDAQVRPGSSLSRNTLTRPAACARCCRFQL